MKLLDDAWASGKPLAHNWKQNPFPNKATSIRGWCDAQGVDWGDPQGYPVQDAQRIERGQTHSRVRAFQEPGGWQRIMFSLSEEENAEAFAEACAVATAAGFELLTP